MAFYICWFPVPFFVSISQCSLRRPPPLTRRSSRGRRRRLLKLARIFFLKNKGYHMFCKLLFPVSFFVSRSQFPSAAARPLPRCSSRGRRRRLFKLGWIFFLKSIRLCHLFVFVGFPCHSLFQYPKVPSAAPSPPPPPLQPQPPPLLV